MQWLSDNPVEVLGYFLMILLRMSGLFVLSPILGRTNIPATARVGLSVMLTFIMLPIVPPTDIIQHMSWIGFALACLLEVAVGLIIGYLTTLFFSAVFIGGQMIDMQIGLGMVQVFDVQSNIQVPVVGNVLNLILMLCFILSDGHVKLIQTMFEFFKLVPPGMVHFGPELAAAVVSAFVRVFILGVSIAMPFIAAGLLSEVGFGILVRIAPQLNIFVIGIPVKTLLGLVMLVFIVPVFVYFTSNIFDLMWDYMGKILAMMVPGSG